MKPSRALLLPIMVSALAAAYVAPAGAEKVYEGQVCSERVHELTNDIDWYRNLHKAEDAARAQGKLVFWVHMLGKIDGAT